MDLASNTRGDEVAVVVFTLSGSVDPTWMERLLSGISVVGSSGASLDVTAELHRPAPDEVLGNARWIDIVPKSAWPADWIRVELSEVPEAIDALGWERDEQGRLYSRFYPDHRPTLQRIWFYEKGGMHVIFEFSEPIRLASVDQGLYAGQFDTRCELQMGEPPVSEDAAIDMIGFICPAMDPKSPISVAMHKELRSESGDSVVTAWNANELVADVSLDELEVTDSSVYVWDF